MKTSNFMRSLLSLVIILVQASVYIPCAAKEPPGFTDVQIEKPFARFLKADPLLMEITGAKVIQHKDGRTILLAVASTVLKDKSAAEQLRAEKVCRIKALAAMVAEQKGVWVCHAETLNDVTTIVIDNKGEEATSVSELLKTTKTKVEGTTKDMPVVGRWKSKNGEVFYLAIGSILTRNGEVEQLDIGK
jgi:hypothetical protein